MKLVKLGPDCESRKSLQPNGGIGTHVVVTTGSVLRKSFHFTLILTNATWNPDPVDDPCRVHLFIRIKINIFGVGIILPFVGVPFFQCCGSGSDPDSIGFVDPESGSRGKKSRKNNKL